MLFPSTKLFAAAILALGNIKLTAAAALPEELGLVKVWGPETNTTATTAAKRADVNRIHFYPDTVDCTGEYILRDLRVDVDEGCYTYPGNRVMKSIYYETFNSYAYFHNTNCGGGSFRSSSRFIGCNGEGSGFQSVYICPGTCQQA